MNIYIGNLSYKAEEHDLSQLFESFGEVLSVKIPTDRETGRKRGFGFVEMENDEEALEAIENLHSTDFLGRQIIVNAARERTPRNDQNKRFRNF